MTSYELHNFIEDYPCQDDKDIQWNIAERKEFNELISDKDKLEKVNRFFKHQQLFLRYLRQYDRIFNIQATGTGKSGTVINAAEYFKSNDSNIKRVYVLEPGPATKKDFQNQIIKLSDPDEYINEKIKYSMSKTSYKNNITRLLKEWYTIETYREFTKKQYNDKMIEEEFSDCLFFFDEAHTLNNLENEEGSGITENERDNVYNFLWKVCHLAKRSKIIVGTATPMVNKAEDFVPLLNLLLPADFQLPSPDRVRKDFYNSVTLNQLEPYFRGKITFIKFSESNINIINKGENIKDYSHNIEEPKSNNNQNKIKPAIKKIEDGKIITIREPKQEYNDMKKVKISSQVKLLFLEMSGVQLKTYKELEKEKIKSFNAPLLQASVFVYPNGDYGSKGFDKYVFKDDLGEYQFKKVFKDKKIITNGLTSLINENDLEVSLENLRLMSSKFHFFIQKELEASNNEKPGNSFNYIEWDKASGATLLGMILRIFGFSEYKSNFVPRDPKTRKIIIEKRKRYLLLTGETKNIQEALNLFNSYENRHGEYIQTVIASKRARVGINIKNVKRGYLTSPVWHESGMYQALSRFIRADSHDMLFKETNEKINVEIYRLCSLNPDIEISKSTDTKMFLLAELKDIQNKRILRYMKQCAFDAFLNYDRNINLLPDVKDGCADADYDKIKFKIFSSEGIPGNDKRKGMALNQGPNSGDYNYTTYNLLYSCHLIKKVKKEIKKIIKDKQIILIDELRDLLPFKITDYILNSSLEELIFNKEIISNKQNTIYYYLKFTAELLYLKRENIFETEKISTENNLYLDNNYPFITKIKEFGGDVKIKILENFYKEYENLNEEELKNFYIQTQDYLLFKTLLEDSLIKLKNKEKLNNINTLILKLLSNYFMIIDKPINYIEKAEQSLKSNSENKQGRKRTEKSVVGLTNLNLNDVKDIRSKEKVYIHFYKDTGNTAFAINSIFESKNRTIRILEENSDKFKDADNSESFVYNYLFDIKYNKILAPFKKSKYYATIIYRGGHGSFTDKEKQYFRIIDNSDEKNRGKVCYHYDSSELIKVLKYLDDKGEYKEMLKKKIKKPILCPLLERIFEKKKLIFYSL